VRKINSSFGIACPYELRADPKKQTKTRDRQNL